MANGFPWFRYYSETVDDQKFQFMVAECGIAKATLIGAWSILLSRASSSPIRGSLYVTKQKRHSDVTVINDFGLGDEVGKKIIKLFKEYELVDTDHNGAIRIIKWEERQPKSDANNAEKQRKYRQKLKEKEEEELRNRYVTVTNDSDSNSYSDSNSLKDIKPFDRDRDIEINDLTKIYMNVTGLLALPSRATDRSWIIDALFQSENKHGENLEAKMKYYYGEWVGRGYSKTSHSWLEWVLNDSVPVKKPKKGEIRAPESVEIYE